MTLGVLVSGRRPAAEAVRLAVAAEQAGLAEVWVSEDYCERGAYAVAGAIAQATERIGIGLGVVNPWTRHPVLTAMEFAALDELAQGRAILGLGSSNPTWMTGMLGIPFTKPLTVLDDTVGVLRDLLRGDRTTRTTVLHDVDAQLAFEPYRRNPPIVLGVKNDRAIRRSAQISDGVLLTVLSPPQYVTWVRVRTGDLPVRGYLALACDADASRARERLRPFVATFLGVHGDHQITRLGGLHPTLAGTLRQAWMDGDDATHLVTDEILDAFAVAGTLEDCAAGVRRYREAGLDVILLRDDPETGTAQAAALMASLQALSSGP